MKELRRPQPGQPRRAADITQCIDAIEEMRQAPLGPGLARTADGTIYATGATRKSEVKVSAEPTGGTPQAIDQTQGTQDTDTWDRDTEDCPVDVEFVTDIEYDTTDHKIYYRTRTFSFNRAGRIDAISAESARVEVTEAVACTGS